MDLPIAEPMTLRRAKAAFDHPDWIFELKHDGFRSLAYVANGRCELVSRRKNHYKKFDHLKAAVAALKASDAILDGEIVCLDGEGYSHFNQLLYRREEPAFYVFDLLWLNGQDLRRLPLIERKKHLHKLIAKSRPDRIIYAQHVAARGTALYDEICERDLEGIVCKRKDGVYSAALQWLKVLNPAYSQRDGRHDRFSAFKQHSVMEREHSPSG